MKQFIENLNPVKFFLIFATIFGLVFLFITPPFQTPDEVVHFYRAYQISEGTFVVQKNGLAAGGFLPSSLSKTVLSTHMETIAANSNAKFNLKWLRNAASIKLDPSKKVFYNFVSTAYYTPIVYIFQSTGILFGRLANLSPIYLMYLGRLGNLAEWILLIGLAIRLIPSKKWVLVAFGLLPMALFEAISLSADSAALGLSALSISLILYYRQRPSIMSWRDLTIFTLVFTALIISKEIMFVFLPMVLLLPLSKIGSVRKRVVATFAVSILPLAMFILWILVVHSDKIASGAAFNPLPSQQIKFIISDPTGYLKVLWNTYFTTYGDYIYRSFIGIFGWLDTPLSILWVIIGYFTLLFLALTDYGKKVKSSLTRNDKLVVLCVLVFYLMAVSTALYAYYSPLKYPRIVGLQGRYFIPLIAVLLPVFANFDLVKTTKSFYKTYAALAVPILLIASTVTIYMRYYVR